MIADYCRKEHPPLWRAAAPEVRLLVALVRRLNSVQELLLAEHNRLAQPGVPQPVQASLSHSITFLEAEVARLEQQIKEHINQHPGLKADKKLLLSIPGIGEATAHTILAELPDVTQFSSAQAAAAYAGLCPREYLVSLWQQRAQENPLEQAG